MAKLTAAKRNALPASSFIGKKDRSYPIPDKSHARNALARASGKPIESKVRAAVHKKFPSIGVTHEAQNHGEGSMHHAPVHVNVHMNFGGKKKFSL